MAEPITSLFVTEKNKVHGSNQWLVLVECEIGIPIVGGVIGIGEPSQAVRVVHSDANFVWNGTTYTATAMSISPNRSNSEGTLESITLTVSNITPSLRSLIEDGNFDGKTCKIRRVNALSGALDVIEYRFQVTSITITWESISFVLAHTNLLNKPYPLNRYLRSICGWQYKSPECGYKGALPTCDKTLGGPDGCRVHGQDEFYNSMPVHHPKNYGGFPGVPESR